LIKGLDQATIEKLKKNDVLNKAVKKLCADNVDITDLLNFIRKS